jgi:antitoxin VapB
MPLNIKDPATDKVVRELAALTGEGVTAAVRRSVEERLSRVRRQAVRRNLAAELQEIADHCASLPELDERSAEEILGYDEHGLPR